MIVTPIRFFSWHYVGINHGKDRIKMFVIMMMNRAEVLVEMPGTPVGFFLVALREDKS